MTQHYPDHYYQEQTDFEQKRLEKLTKKISELIKEKGLEHVLAQIILKDINPY